MTEDQPLPYQGDLVRQRAARLDELIALTKDQLLVLGYSQLHENRLVKADLLKKLIVYRNARRRIRTYYKV